DRGGDGPAHHAGGQPARHEPAPGRSAAVLAAAGFRRGSRTRRHRRPRAPGLELQLDEGLPPVEADPALLERAVANVIENAIRWSPPDRPVRVEAGAFSDRVDLRIVDRGPGIPVGLREQVFAPFQRLGDTDAGTGVGLGLAVARGFVQAIRGTVEIEDTAGGGTTVVLSLPAASVANRVADSTALH